MWISEETLSGVFDLASQMNNDSWRNSKTKFAKFYGNLIVSKLPVVVVIFFVYSLRIINEFEKIVFLWLQVDVYFRWLLESKQKIRTERDEV